MNIVQKIINSIGGKTKNLEMLEIFLDHLKTKKIYKGAVKKLSFIVRYVHDQLINLRLKICVIKLFSITESLTAIRMKKLKEAR